MIFILLVTEDRELIRDTIEMVESVATCLNFTEISEKEKATIPHYLK